MDNQYQRHEVIPNGWVQLIGSMGSDLDIVNSARISYNKQHKELSKGDPKLIEYLMKHRHGTPFEAVEFHFQVKAPIFVVREWHRHRIASYNEVSGRYTELNCEAYLPAGRAIREQIGKPGAYTYQSVDHNRYHNSRKLIEDTYNTCFKAYNELLEMGIAKEIARIILPVGLFTEFRFKTNARSLMNFLSLRNALNAMLEIRLYAEAIEEDFKAILPHTHAAFIENGRQAP